MQAAFFSFDEICGNRTSQPCSTKRYGALSSSKLSPVAAPLHQQTEATLAQHLALALTTASVTMQLTSSGIIFEHACRQIIDTGATSVTILISI